MMEHAHSFSTIICGVSFLPNYFERLSRLVIISITLEDSFILMPTVLARMPSLQYLALVFGVYYHLQIIDSYI